MKQLTKIGRVLYGVGIASLGVHQFLIKDFRPEILPPFPAWAHEYLFFPILAGIVLVLTGVTMMGLFTTRLISARKTGLYFGFSLLVLIVTCHLPYILFLSPDKASRLDVWFGAAEALAYAGGAFVLAGSFPKDDDSKGKKSFQSLLEKLIPLGSIFFSMLIILFGTTHFVFTDFVSTMVPKFFGVPLFWTYLAGVALIGAGVAIILRIWVRIAALLLAILLFLFFIFFHVPDAFSNPYELGGNEIVRAIVALLFCGIALVIASTSTNNNQQKRLKLKSNSAS